MARTFVNVTQSDFEAHFSPLGFVPLVLAGTVELVYAKIVRHNDKTFSLRIYTGILPSGSSRGVGQDAMRLEVWFRKDATDTPVRVGGSKRVNRVGSWFVRLNERINAWLSQLGKDCPACGCPMVERENNKTGDKFWGCSQYRKTGCKGRPLS